MILLATLALAATEPEVPTGTPIASVALEAPLGGLPKESLLPLLRARQGDPYDPQATRQDLTTLLRVGDFAGVEAHLEPWFVEGPDGEPVPAVLLSYQVVAAPRAAKLRVQGNRAFNSKNILDAAGIATGQAFYPDLDGTVAKTRVEDWMRKQGWVEARVEVDAIALTTDSWEIWIRVDEGEPNLLTRVEFVGQIPPEVGTETLLRWARSEGVKLGKPISSEAIKQATFGLRTRLGRITGNLLSPPRGWIGARLVWTVDRVGSDVALTWVVEPGPKLELSVQGLKYRAKRKVRDALGIDARLRLTRGFVDDAGPRLEEALARKGFHAARAVAELRTGDVTQTLYVEVDRGARHGLEGFPPRNSLSFTGNQALHQRALTRAADQASPKVIRLDRYTRDELDRGLVAMKNIYASMGYEDVRLSLAELEIEPVGTKLTRPLLTALYGITGAPLAQRIKPVIAVDEGVQTLHGRLRLTGTAATVDTLDVERTLAEREGAPFDPSALERIARTVVERHRQAGYLRANVAVTNTVTDAGPVDSELALTTGPLVLLRSVAIRGSRHTQPWFIRRELELTRGEPLTTTDLERARRRLYQLGIFKSVGIDLLGEGDARDLLVTVDERARWGAEAGIGVNTDQGARVFARGLRRNLFGIGHRLDTHGIFGINYASDSLTNWTPDLNSLEWRVAIRYTAPHFPSRSTDLVLDVLLQERLQERTYRMARTGAGITLDVNLGQHTRLSNSLRFELRDLQQYDPRALLDSEPWKVLDQEPTAPGCRPCRLAESMQVVLVHDRRNDPIQPNRGFLTSTIAELAPGIPWQRAELRSRFVKAEARAVGFIPLGKLVLQLSGEAGHARSLGSGPIPLEDRYRLGGTGSMRGFALQSVGPRNRAPSVPITWPIGLQPLLELAESTTPPRWIPTGGDTKAIGVAELVVPLPALGLASWDGYALAAFADVGNVWHLGRGSPTSANTPNVPVIRSSTGLGIRIATPIGPLQLDVASNNQRMFSGPEQRALLRDQWEEPPLRAHLSLGSLW